MGCDIHAYAEKKSKHGWWDFDRKVARDRDYEFFSAIADVRTRKGSNNVFKPKGFPEDADSDTQALFENWGSDAHTPSFLTLAEIRALVDRKVIVSGMMDAQQLEEVKAEFAAGNFKTEKLYPYCQATNAPNHVRFELEMPFTALTRMPELWIQELEKIDGADDEKRIVFWFDN